MSSKDVDGVITRTLNNNVAIFTLSSCSICRRLTEFLKAEEILFYKIDIDEHELYNLIFAELVALTNQKKAPFVFIRRRFIGNFNTVLQKYHEAKFLDLISGMPAIRYDYEVIVIGGGCGGLAAAKEAAQLGKKVALFDYVNPNATGFTWTGLGGTSTNTGSVPKRLMYQASLIGDFCEDGKYFGWNFEFNKLENHNWKEMVTNIHNYIKKINAGFRQHCRSVGVKIFNAYVTRFFDSHTIEAIDKDGTKAKFTSHMFILATGGRPFVPNFPGSEYVITSDDLFYLPENPGKTLVIGGGFLALECAGFLNGFGIDCTVLTKNEVLIKHDGQIVDMISSHLKSLGIKFINVNQDIEIKSNKERADKFSKKYRVNDAKNLKYTLKFKTVGSLGHVDKIKDMFFDTILIAVGRKYSVADMGLQTLGVKINETTGRITVNKYDRTHCSTIFAIGDIADGHFEVAPVAVKAGKLLARRILGSEEVVDYSFVPMALFTPLEYSFCGYTEEKAKELYGENNITIYQSRFHPLEWAMQRRNHNRSYIKIICLKNDLQKVIGVHILGPNAAEITQGFAFAMKLKAKKSDLDAFIGIHRTCGDCMTKLRITSEIHVKTLTPTGSAAAMLL